MIFQERDKRLEPTDGRPDVSSPFLRLESEVLRVVDPGHQVLVLRVEHSPAHGPVLPGTTDEQINLGEINGLVPFYGLNLMFLPNTQNTQLKKRDYFPLVKRDKDLKDNFTCEGVHRLLPCDQRGWNPW